MAQISRLYGETRLKSKGLFFQIGLVIRPPRGALSNKRKWPKTRGKNVVQGPHCRLYTGGMWSKRQIKYFI